VRQIGRVFASAGMFVWDKVKEAGRSDFVAGYEGQTVAQTMDFLRGGLDHGVIFIDEAYAITQWNNGGLDAYGNEAITAMTDFMTKYMGLYCIMCAGYEKEMTRYFLPSNPGIARRFPYRSVIRPYTAGQLVDVFKRKLLEDLGFRLPSCDPALLAAADQFFTRGAWAFLKYVIKISLSGQETFKDEEFDEATQKTYKNVRVFTPTWALMYEVFKNQAGSMTNLAEEFVVRISREKLVPSLLQKDGAATDIDLAKLNRAKVGFNKSQAVMEELILDRLKKSAIDGYERTAAEFESVKREANDTVDAEFEYRAEEDRVTGRKPVTRDDPHPPYALDSLPVRDDGDDGAEITFEELPDPEPPDPRKRTRKGQLQGPSRDPLGDVLTQMDEEAAAFAGKFEPLGEEGIAELVKQAKSARTPWTAGSLGRVSKGGSKGRAGTRAAGGGDPAAQTRAALVAEIVSKFKEVYVAEEHYALQAASARTTDFVGHGVEQKSGGDRKTYDVHIFEIRLPGYGILAEVHIARARQGAIPARTTVEVNDSLLDETKFKDRLQSGPVPTRARGKGGTQHLYAQGFDWNDSYDKWITTLTGFLSDAVIILQELLDPPAL